MPRNNQVSARERKLRQREEQQRREREARPRVARRPRRAARNPIQAAPIVVTTPPRGERIVNERIFFTDQTQMAFYDAWVATVFGSREPQKPKVAKIKRNLPDWF